MTTLFGYTSSINSIEQQIIDIQNRLNNGGTLPLTTKGDLVTRNISANTRLPVGSDGQILTADSTTATGLKYTSTISSPTISGTLTMPTITTDASTTPLVRDGTSGIIYSGINYATAGNSLTLSNKSLVDTSTVIVNAVDSTKTLSFQTQDSGTGISTTVRTFSSVNRIITLPNATTTLLGDNNTTAMSNKTIDSALNTLTITNSPLSAANVNTLINQAVLTTSSPTFRLATITNVGGGSMAINPGGVTGTLNLTSVQTANRNVIFPDIAGTVIIDSGSQTLTGKTIAYGSNTITGLPVSSYGYAAYYRNAAQSISNSTETTVAFDTAIATDSGVSNASGVFTINTTGIYTITATVAYAANATGFRFVYFKLNTSPIYYNEMMTTATSATNNVCVMTMFTGLLTAGDTIKVITAQLSGGALNLIGYTTYGGNNVTMVQFTRIS